MCNISRLIREIILLYASRSYFYVSNLERDIMLHTYFCMLSTYNSRPMCHDCKMRSSVLPMLFIALELVLRSAENGVKMVGTDVANLFRKGALLTNVLTMTGFTQAARSDMLTDYLNSGRYADKYDR